MKEFACGAVVPGCVAVFQGQTDDEILSQVAEHAQKDHGLTEIDDQLVGAVKSNIQTV
jgi:predicted small metal-binding protein